MTKAGANSASASTHLSFCASHYWCNRVALLQAGLSTRVSGLVLRAVVALYAQADPILVGPPCRYIERAMLANGSGSCDAQSERDDVEGTAAALFSAARSDEIDVLVTLIARGECCCCIQW